MVAHATEPSDTRSAKAKRAPKVANANARAAKAAGRARAAKAERAARAASRALAAELAQDPDLRVTLAKASLRYSRPTDRGIRREGTPPDKFR